MTKSAAFFTVYPPFSKVRRKPAPKGGGRSRIGSNYSFTVSKKAAAMPMKAAMRQAAMPTMALVRSAMF